MDQPDVEWFKRIANQGELVFCILRVQPNLAFEFVNDAVELQLGCTVEQALADPWAVLDLIEPGSRDPLLAMLSMLPGERATIELNWQHVDKRSVTTQLWLESRRRADGSVVLEGVSRDVTKARRDADDLRRSEQRHRLLAENAWDVIWTMALDGTITYVSPAVERVRGLTPQEAMSQTLEQIHPPDSAVRVLDYYARLFAAIAAGDDLPVFRGEQEYYRKDGSIMTGELQVIPHVDTDGQVVEILGVTRDVSDRRDYEQELTRLAITDTLTGVWNRRHGDQLVRLDVERAMLTGHPHTLLMIDVDHFKDINDHFGHHVGDQTLIAVTECLAQTLRDSDDLIRWGGEEFVVVLRDCDLNQARELAERLRARAAATAFDQVGSLSVSVGAAQLLPDDDVDSWLRRADAALYEAKAAGRNVVRAAQ